MEKQKNLQQQGVAWSRSLLRVQSTECKEVASEGGQEGSQKKGILWSRVVPGSERLGIFRGALFA